MNNTEKTTTKLTGTEARAVIAQVSQDQPVRLARRAVIAKMYEGAKPYDPEELMATPFTSRSGGVVATQPADAIQQSQQKPILMGIHCPLCRRRSTVTLLQIADKPRGEATYKCSYSGCFGLEFEM